MNTNLVSADLSRAFQRANTVSAGIRFHYLFRGTGFPVILLSGFPQSSYAWRKVIPELARNYRVVAPDLPGQGDSDLPTDGYDTTTVAQRLDLFLSELGLDRFHLVGHDVGAWVAFTYAATFRSKIETLTVIDAVSESMEQNRELSAKKLSFPVLAIGGERGSTPNIGNDLRSIAPNTRGLVFRLRSLYPRRGTRPIGARVACVLQSSRAIAEKGSLAQRTRRTQRKTEKERSNGVLE